MARIYVSSTFNDLRDCREAVIKILRRMRHEVVAMEDYTAEDRWPADKLAKASRNAATAARQSQERSYPVAPRACANVVGSIAKGIITVSRPLCAGQASSWVRARPACRLGQWPLSP